MTIKKKIFALFVILYLLIQGFDWLIFAISVVTLIQKVGLVHAVRAEIYFFKALPGATLVGGGLKILLTIAAAWWFARFNRQYLDAKKVADVQKIKKENQGLAIQGHSEPLSDEDYSGETENAMEGYRRELIKFHGEENGQKRFEQASKDKRSTLDKQKQKIADRLAMERMIDRLGFTRVKGDETLVFFPPNDLNLRNRRKKEVNDKRDDDGWTINPSQINPKNNKPSF